MSVEPEVKRYGRGRGRRAMFLLQEDYRNLERQRFLDLLDPQPTDRVFDVGCSTGRLLDALRNRYHVAEAKGCDIDPQLTSPERGIMVASGEDLAGVPDEHFTKVIFSHSLEHIPNRPTALAEAARILTDDGRLCISFFLYTEETRQAESVASCFDTPPPIVSAEQLHLELKQAGFVIMSERTITQLTNMVVQRVQIPSLLIEAKKLLMITHT